MYLVLKALLSGAIVVAASEVARRSSILGAIIVSLPITSILAMIWLYRDTGDDREVSDLSWAILWVFAPSLVFFVVLPLLLIHDVSFWPSLVLSIAATALAYAAWVFAGRQVGLDF